LNETQFRVHVASMQRRFEKVASIDPAEVSERLLADEEFRQKVMNAIAALNSQLASNEQFGIAKGQQNNSPETWHLVSFLNGLGSINREQLTAFIESQIDAQIKNSGSSNGAGGGLTHQEVIDIFHDILSNGKFEGCKPQQPLWRTMDGALESETKHDVHIFAPFSFPKKMPNRIKFFDRLTFIPVNANEQCGVNRPGTGNCNCSWEGSGADKDTDGTGCGDGDGNGSGNEPHDPTPTETLTPEREYFGCFVAEVLPDTLITLKGVFSFSDTFLSGLADFPPRPASYYTTPIDGWWGFHNSLSPPPPNANSIINTSGNFGSVPVGTELTAYTIWYDGSRLNISLWDNNPSTFLGLPHAAAVNLFKAANVTIGTNNVPFVQTPYHVEYFKGNCFIEFHMPGMNSFLQSDRKFHFALKHEGMQYDWRENYHAGDAPEKNESFYSDGRFEFQFVLPVLSAGEKRIHFRNRTSDGHAYYRERWWFVQYFSATEKWIFAPSNFAHFDPDRKWELGLRIEKNISQGLYDWIRSNGMVKYF